MSKFHDRLEELKDEKGNTQTKIAEDLGISPQTLSYYFNGREPNYDLLCDIADYFNVSTDYLLGMDVYRNKEDKKTALSLSNGNSAELPCTIQNDAAKLYSQLLECLCLSQKVNDSVFVNENHLAARLSSDLIYNLSSAIEAYKMAATYLEQGQSFSSTIYKFKEMINKIPSLANSIENIAYFYKLSEKPLIQKEGVNSANDTQAR